MTLAMDAGLFGGTFNPIHNGHLGIAAHVKSCFSLDRVIFFPSATPPHKPGGNLAPAQDRYEMVVQSLEGKKGFTASDIELKRLGPSFTIDTLEAFRSAYGSGTCFYLLMGSDAFFDIPSWKRTRDIFEAVPIIIMLRGDQRRVDAYISFVDEHISKGYTWEQKGNHFSHGRLKPIYICHVPRIDISSTMIRNRIRRHQSVSSLVPSPVADMIRQKDLYL